MDGNEVLSGATVALLKTQFGTITGVSGTFELKDVPPGKYQLRVTYVGFENFQQEVEIKDGDTTHISIQMIPLAANLNEVVISGTMREATKLQSITPVDVYAMRYFERNPTNNLWDALSNVNGVFPDIDNGVSNTTDVQINGLEGNYTMILIDGAPAMNGLAGVYALNSLPMSMIEKIEIVRGANSTLYGSNAIGGVVNIITKNPVKTASLSIDASLTSKLEDNLDLTGAFVAKKVSALFSANIENMNYRWDIDGNGFTDIPLTNRANFYNKWSIRRKDEKMANIYARGLFEDRFGGDITTPGRLVGSGIYYTQWIRTYQWQAGFHYQLPVKDKIMISGDYSEHYQHSWFGNFNYAGTQRNAFAQITWGRQVDTHNNLLIGGCYRMQYYSDNTGLSADSLTGFNKFQHIGGVFIEDEINIVRGQELLLGTRFDYTSSNGPVVSPRINYRFSSKNEKNILRIGFSTGYRTPNVINEGFGILNGSRLVEVSSKLKPETAITAQANYTRVQELPGGLLNIDASAFYTYFINHIDPSYDEPGLVVYDNNRHGAMAPGCSINTDFTFNYPLKIGIGLTYTYAFAISINETTGAKERELAVHNPNLTGNFFFSYNFPVPQLSLEWTGTVYSPMLLVTEVNDYRPEKSPWFTLQNIMVTKKFGRGVELYFGLKNFFNFIQKDAIMRPFDPFNRNVTVNNPNNYYFDTQYGFMSTEGIKGFIGFRYKLIK
ncbi:MAG TPA: TonB-dependent receptor [Chitinophagales bacterium]|nr:TonB-dependent receptor [Chitinophagales bacterium]